jgi:hypothetical protein
VRAAITVAASLILALGPLGCARLNTDGTRLVLRPAQPTEANSIQVIGGAPSRPYDRLALVSAYSYSSFPQARTAALDELKRQAARAGANAIIEVRQRVLTAEGVRYLPWPDTTPEVEPTGRLQRWVTPLLQERAVLLRGEAVQLH